jgi:hypothetical protein
LSDVGKWARCAAKWDAKVELAAPKPAVRECAKAELAAPKRVVRRCAKAGVTQW